MESFNIKRPSTEVKTASHWLLNQLNGKIMVRRIAALSLSCIKHTPLCLIVTQRQKLSRKFSWLFNVREARGNKTSHFKLSNLCQKLKNLEQQRIWEGKGYSFGSGCYIWKSSCTKNHSCTRKRSNQRVTRKSHQKYKSTSNVTIRKDKRQLWWYKLQN